MWGAVCVGSGGPRLSLHPCGAAVRDTPRARSPLMSVRSLPHFTPSHFSHSPLLFLVFQGGAEEAKAFVEELLQWKAEAMMSRVDDAKKDAP